MDDEVQLCPFCTQPFSGIKMNPPYADLSKHISFFLALALCCFYLESTVVDDKFVKEPVKFSNQTTAFGQDLNGFSSAPKKGSFVLAHILTSAQIN